MGLMLAVDRRIPDNVADSRRGRWDKAAASAATGLAGPKGGGKGVWGQDGPRPCWASVPTVIWGMGAIFCEAI